MSNIAYECSDKKCFTNILESIQWSGSWLKLNHLLNCATVNISWKFHQNPSITHWVILQTNKQTNTSTHIISLAELNLITSIQTKGVPWWSLCQVPLQVLDSSPSHPETHSFVDQRLISPESACKFSLLVFSYPLYKTPRSEMCWKQNILKSWTSQKSIITFIARGQSSTAL